MFLSYRQEIPRKEHTMDNSTTAPSQVYIRRGAGTKVHFATVLEGRVIGTRCATDVNLCGGRSLRLTQVEGPATCKACLK